MEPLYPEKQMDYGNPPPYQNAALPYQNTPPPEPERSVVVISRTSFGKLPVQITCANCHQQVITTVTTERGVCTWIAVLIVFLICFPFFWVPMVIDSCKDYRHYCPSCHVVLGLNKRICQRT